jgi:hypothetical protein
VKVLALSFLLMIGVLLIADGFDRAHPERLRLLRDGLLSLRGGPQHPRPSARGPAGEAASALHGCSGSNVAAGAREPGDSKGRLGPCVVSALTHSREQPDPASATADKQIARSRLIVPSIVQSTARPGAHESASRLGFGGVMSATNDLDEWTQAQKGPVDVGRAGEAEGARAPV